MPIVRGPLHSDGASGSIAGSAVFLRRYKQDAVRHYVNPTNPNTSKQQGIRLLTTWLSKMWPGLSTSDRTTWTLPANRQRLSNYHAMLSYNQKRCHDHRGPTDAYPAAELGTAVAPDYPPNPPQNLLAMGFQGYAMATAFPRNDVAADAIAAILYRGSTEPTPRTWTNASAIFTVTPGLRWWITQSELPPATYHYKLAYFSNDGVISVLSAADTTAVVT